MNEWQRKSHDVEVIPIDSGYVYSSITLNCVSPCFIENVFPAQIVQDLNVRQSLEPDACTLESLQNIPLHLIDNGYSRVDTVFPSGEFSEHPKRFLFI